MTMWLLVPLFALAQASCYDYEYYDPATGSSLPGNACNKGGKATGQPVAAPASTTSFSGSSVAPASFTAPIAGTPIYSAPAASAAPVYGAPLAPAAPIYTAPAAAAPAAAAPIYGTPVAPAAPIYTAPATSIYTAATPIYGAAAAPVVSRTVAVSTPVYGTTVSAPAAVTVSRGAAGPSAPKVGADGQTQLSQRQIEYYKRIGEQQQRDHRINQRIVKRANEDLTRSNLVNRIVAGNGKVADWYPIYRLGQQKRISDAFQDEVRIANRNAEDAYDRFKQNPTRLNMLVSKYQDLNADLREASSHYNNVNAGTFGQRLTSTGLFGGSNLMNIVTQTIVQRQEVDDLSDIQDDMNRVARQIQAEVKRLQQGGATATASASANQQQGAGSVQQRMMAMSVYGPQRG